MYSHGDDGVASTLFWSGWTGWEPETARPFYKLAASARVTLDIGAHVGYFALLASHANPVGRVYAFEPLPRTVERLERNIRLNGSPNVSCQALAIGSPSGTAEFFHVKEEGIIPKSSSLSQRFMQSIASTQELTSSAVNVMEVDDFVEANGLADVDLIKVDTETTEDAVFQGMIRTLRRDHPVIMCEVLNEETGKAIEAILRPLSYEFFLLTSSGEVRRDHIRPDPLWRNFTFRPVGQRS